MLVGGPAVLLTPAALVAVTALFSALPLVEPRREHLAQSTLAYTACWVGTVAFLAFAHLQIVAFALGRATSLDLLPLGLGVLLVVLGNHLPTTRSTFFLGVRTPWTLTSERSWQRTHRLAGVLFVVLGVAVVGATLTTPTAWLEVLLAGTASILLVMVPHSSLVRREDPDRSPAGR